MKLNEVMADEPIVSVSALAFERTQWEQYLRAENKYRNLDPIEENVGGRFFTLLGWTRGSIRSILTDRIIVKQWNLRGLPVEQTVGIVRGAIKELVDPYTVDVRALDAGMTAVHDFMHRASMIKDNLRLILTAETENDHPLLILVSTHEGTKNL